MMVAYFFDLGFAPDAVVNLDGFNEAAYAWSNIQTGANPAYPDFGIWAHTVQGGVSDRRDMDTLLDIRMMQREIESIATFALRYRIYASSLLGRLTLQRLTWRGARAVERRNEYVARLASDPATTMRGPRVEGKPANAFDAAVRTWKESSRSLQALCGARSIYYLHVLQPTLHDVGSKTPTESERAEQGRYSQFSEGVHALYPRFKTAGEELRVEGVNFHDGSMTFAAVSEQIYYDHCHFDRLGNEMLGGRIADAFLAGLPAGETTAGGISGR
jgi:hypothetical protein